MERWRCLVGIPVVEEEKRVVKGKQAVCRAVGELRAELSERAGEPSWEAP